MPESLFNKVVDSLDLYFKLKTASGMLWDWDEGIHLTLPPRIFSVLVKWRGMLHYGSVLVSLKKSKRNLKKPNPNPNPNP